MVILINGSFGIGKTTVARLLSKRIKKSVILDPELIGFVLQRLSRFIPLRGRGTDDFQDISLWRKATFVSTFLLHRITRRNIIVPMAYSNLDYVNQLRLGLIKKGIAIHRFCLVAPIEVVHERLKKRGTIATTEEGKWVYPRVSKCCAVHKDPEFNQQIDTEKLTPQETTDEIVGYLQNAEASTK